MKRALLTLGSIACSASAGGPEIVFEGPPDASAAVWLADGSLLVAEDEANTLRVYAPTGGPPLRTLALGGDDEIDLEGAARVGDRVWLIGSHGRSRKGKDRPSRRALLAVSTADGGLVREPGSVDLLPALLALPTVGATLAAAEPLPPKAGGISIEGLAAGPEGSLLVGFRSPLHEGRAIVAQLLDPDAAIAGAPRFGETWSLDLGGQGIRSLEAADGGFWIVAGSPGPGDDFALYRWAPGAAPERVGADWGDLRPEALVEGGESRALLLSDDGSTEKPAFRGRWVRDPGG